MCTNSDTNIIQILNIFITEIFETVGKKVSKFSSPILALFNKFLSSLMAMENNRQTTQKVKGEQSKHAAIKRQITSLCRVQFK